MPPDLILANATLVLPDETCRGSVRLSAGRIADIDTGGGVPSGAVDCGGDFVAPGLIELHTDNLERHIRPRPGVDWPHNAAIVAHDAELASMGITTVFDAIRVGSIPSHAQAGPQKYARSMADEILAMRATGALKISHHLHLRAELCSETLEDELAEFGPDDRVGIVSLMDHTPGQRQFRNPEQFLQWLREEDGLSEHDAEAYLAFLRDLQTRLRPRHERAAVAAAAAYGAVLASHDDTTHEQVAASRDLGVSLAEFPTTMAAAEACHAADIGVIMGAPNLVRGGSHSGNVAAGELAEAGRLDILSSDYVPVALLMGALILGDMWGDMARGLAKVTAAPAAGVGLADRGRLELGLRADVIRFRRTEATPLLHGVWCAGRQVA